jgi:L-ascorbate metabolism protein UlaG (beta-lactamase superfamily)
MRSLRLLIFGIELGLVVCGCEKEKPQTEKQAPGVTEKTEEKETGKEAVMGVSLQWLGHASFKIRHDKTVIYIDPWKLKMPADEATLVLISHSHYDHYSAEDIVKVTGPNTKLIAPPDVIATEKGGEPIASGVTIEAGAVKVTGVAAYNTAKQFHPKSNKWVGFIIEVGGKRIYYAGDTDITDEMKALKNIDVALLPVGGKYTMNAEEAAEATKSMKPKRAFPYHYGDIVGSRSDAEKFSQLAGCEVKILRPGETLSLE